MNILQWESFWWVFTVLNHLDFITFFFFFLLSFERFVRDKISFTLRKISFVGLYSNFSLIQPSLFFDCVFLHSDDNWTFFSQNHFFYFIFKFIIECIWCICEQLMQGTWTFFFLLFIEIVRINRKEFYGIHRIYSIVYIHSLYWICVSNNK